MEALNATIAEKSRAYPFISWNKLGEARELPSECGEKLRQIDESYQVVFDARDPEKEIRRVYKQHALQYHPDKEGGDRPIFEFATALKNAYTHEEHGEGIRQVVLELRCLRKTLAAKRQEREADLARIMSDRQAFEDRQAREAAQKEAAQKAAEREQAQKAAEREQAIKSRINSFKPDKSVDWTRKQQLLLINAIAKHGWPDYYAFDPVVDQWEKNPRLGDNDSTWSRIKDEMPKKFAKNNDICRNRYLRMIQSFCKDATGDPSEYFTLQIFCTLAREEYKVNKAYLKYKVVSCTRHIDSKKINIEWQNPSYIDDFEYYDYKQSVAAFERCSWNTFYLKVYWKKYVPEQLETVKEGNVEGAWYGFKEAYENMRKLEGASQPEEEVAEEARQAEEAEEARLVEEARLAEEARLEAARKEERRQKGAQQKAAQEARKAEAEAEAKETARQAEEAKEAKAKAAKAEAEAEAAKAEAARQAEEAKEAKAEAEAEEARKAEAAAKAEEAKAKREAKKAAKAEEARQAEKARQAEEVRQAEEAKVKAAKESVNDEEESVINDEESVNYEEESVINDEESGNDEEEGTGCGLIDSIHPHKKNSTDTWKPKSGNKRKPSPGTTMKKALKCHKQVHDRDGSLDKETKYLVFDTENNIKFLSPQGPVHGVLCIEVLPIDRETPITSLILSKHPCNCWWLEDPRLQVGNWSEEQMDFVKLDFGPFKSPNKAVAAFTSFAKPDRESTNNRGPHHLRSRKSHRLLGDLKKHNVLAEEEMMDYPELTS